MRALILCVLIAAGCHTPKPAPPSGATAGVTTLDAAGLTALRQDFDARKDRPRLLALLSPG
jgi:hypothetical protein